MIKFPEASGRHPNQWFPKIASLPGRELIFLIMGWIRFNFFSLTFWRGKVQFYDYNLKDIYCKTF